MNLHKLFAFTLDLGLSLDLETNILGIGLSLVTETRRFKVSVSVSSQIFIVSVLVTMLRLGFWQSRSRNLKPGLATLCELDGIYTMAHQCEAPTSSTELGAIHK